MDVGGGSVAAETPALEGGGRRTRRRRGQRRTRVAQEGGGGADVAVEKADGPTVIAAPATVPVPAPVAQKGGAAAQPKPKSALKATAVAPPTAPLPTKVVIAPPKKKAPKLLFVPKNKVAGSPGHRVTAAKTFKARRVSVTIDNTAKTQKRRRQTVQKVEGMSVDQLRGAAVAAKLSRRETVEKVPADLLRQMLKDYYMMRGMLV